ncbi:hypothetical protein M422DRAFT_226573 [Sphaerobolus stellatus SS14]|uniref:T6SS Phospholipase effector Tle1-like catalytic domain-containing protein n=1 Tax=Sphaerobolus stellatus (strain SS14) TaxID=990650 RepID=A0A0C9UV00_SPHS4|nr:hypothetical protein M422DRAFT_226573 [Sphaerobolus stellatus SS14]
MGDVIPTHHPARTLVLCFDGTGDCFDQDNSNIVQFFSMLQKGNRDEQMVYYQAGIGTYTVPEIATPLMSKISKTLDMMIAWNLDAHVMGGYEFLMQNYTVGDRICIFGFSRGAYTARALAGMIHKVGLLPQGNRQQVPFAYKMYTSTTDLGWKQSTAFKKAFSMDVDIEFLGVWDTVSSVGIIPRTLPFTTSNSVINTFRHAVSLDEHRARFPANLYNRPTAHEAALGTQPGEMPKVDVKYPGPPHQQQRSDSGKHKTMRAQEREFTESEGRNRLTDVLEVWFAGCHCDVGGGSVDNESRHNLARIPLRWMIRQCFLAKTGIRFHGELLRTIGLEPASLYPEVLPRPEALEVSALDTFAKFKKPKDFETIEHNAHLTEEQEELIDSLCPIYDQLSLAPHWWLLEFFPTKERVQDEHNHWKKEITVNAGRGRIIRAHQHCDECTINVHRSVKVRMEAAELLPRGKYTPKARMHNTTMKFVD